MLFINFKFLTNLAKKVLPSVSDISSNCEKNILDLNGINSLIVNDLMIEEKKINEIIVRNMSSFDQSSPSPNVC